MRSTCGTVWLYGYATAQQRVNIVQVFFSIIVVLPYATVHKKVSFLLIKPRYDVNITKTIGEIITYWSIMPAYAAMLEGTYYA